MPKEAKKSNARNTDQTAWGWTSRSDQVEWIGEIGLGMRNGTLPILGVEPKSGIPCWTRKATMVYRMALQQHNWRRKLIESHHHLG